MEGKREALPAEKQATLHVARGVELQGKGDLHGAVEAYRAALEADSTAYEAHNNLGSVFAGLGDRKTALVFFRAAAAANPQATEVWRNLANALAGEGELDPALEAYRTALRLEPLHVGCHSDLGNALRAAGRFEEAQAALEKAVSLRPEYAEGHVNLGVCLWEQGRVEEAMASMRQAIALAPKLAQAHANLGKLLLRAGEWEAGWRESEWRWRCKDFPAPRRVLEQPQWRGEPLDGARILLHAEQGFGDTIQFARYAPMVAERGAQVVLEVQPELVTLMRTLPGAERVIALGESLPEFDWHCPLMSLPLAFGTQLESIPATTPYLFAGRASNQGGGESGLRIGLVWAGSATSSIDHFRSLRLEELEPLAGVNGVSLVSLQRGAEASGSGPVRFAERLPATGDFAATAELVATLDLVITVDSAMAHLAGAMGKSVWILLPAVSDWRWLVDRTDSPWYPTARLFRQETRGEWGPVVARVRRELRELAASRVGAGKANP